MGRLKNIDSKIDQILKSIDDKTIYKAKKYDEIIDLLKNVVLNADIKQLKNEQGENEYLITYSTKTLLKFDADGEMMDNYLFRAINLLNLVDIDTMNEFSNILQIEKNNKKVK